MSRQGKRLESAEVVLDAVISLLHKKDLIRRDEVQSEILARAKRTDEPSVIGGIEYKL